MNIVRKLSFSSVLKACLALVGFLVLLHLVSWVLGGNAWLFSRKFAADQLSEVLPMLEVSRVTQFRDQDWCKVLIYDEGEYWVSSHPTTCVLGPEPRQDGEQPSFSKVANSDFRKMRNRLLLTGLNVRSLYVRYTDKGDLMFAEFNLRHSWPWYSRFTYSPNEILSDLGGEATNYILGDGWYFTIEDWL